MNKNNGLVTMLASGATALGVAATLGIASNAPAQAASLLPGSNLAIFGASNIIPTGPGATDILFFNYNDVGPSFTSGGSFAPLDTYGDFQVSVTSTGSFAGLPQYLPDTPAGANNPVAPYPGGPQNYDILSFNATTLSPGEIAACAAAVSGGLAAVQASCTPSLAIRTADNTLWRFAFTSFTPSSSGDSVTAVGDGVWFDGSPQLGRASFSGEFGPETFSANIKVNEVVVPEPSSVVGLVAFGLAGATFISRKQKQK